MKKQLLALLHCIIIAGSATSATYAADRNSNTKPSAPQVPLTGFNVLYAESYRFDICGDSDAGKWYREAIITQVESCPMPLATKTTFYKDAALIADDELSGFMRLYATHSFPSATLPEQPKLSCAEFLAQPETKTLHNILSQYHLGKAKPSEVFVKPFWNTPAICENGAKDLYESAPVSVGSFKTQGK